MSKKERTDILMSIIISKKKFRYFNLFNPDCDILDILGCVYIIFFL